MSTLNLKTLALDGFMGYAQKTIIPLDGKGVTAILGSTGSGKSTILEAVYYLLTGDTLRNKRSVKDLVNKTKNAGYEIALIFEFGGNEYTIKEIRERSGSGLFFYVNDELKQGSGQSDTRKRIAAALPVSPEDLAALSFLGQNQTQVLTRGTPGMRGKEIMRLFGLNRYELYIKSADAAVKEIVSQQQIVQANISKEVADLDQLQKTLSECPSAVNTDGSDILRLQGQAKSVQEKLEKIRKVYVDSQKKLAKHQILSSRKLLREQLKASVQRLIVQHSTVRFLPDTASIQNDLHDSQQEQWSTRQKISATSENIQKMRDWPNRCPLNKQDCPVGVPAITREERTRNFNAELEDLRQKMQKIEEYLAYVNDTLAQAKQRDELAQELQTTQKRLQDIEADPEDNVNLEEINEIVRKCEKSLAIGEAKHNDLQAKLGALQCSLENNKKNSQVISDLKKMIEDRHTKLDSYKHTMEVLEKQYHYTMAALQLFKKVSIYKIDLVLDLLNESMSVLEQISDGRYRAEFVTQRRDSTGKRMMDEVDIVFMDGNKQLPIGMICGGEDAQVQLAVLLAVFETARQITGKSTNTLWLDEIFGPISADTIDRVFEVLATLVKRLGVASVKIISHRELDKRLFDHIWIAESVNGTSSLTIKQ